MAIAMKNKMTVQNLQNLELCYAPPFSNAKEGINIAGHMANSVLEGELICCSFEEICNPGLNSVIIDVRK